MYFARKIVSNTFYQIIGKIVTAGSALIGTIFITKLLGAHTFGEYSIVTAYIMTYYLIADFGVSAIITRDFAKDAKTARMNFSSILTLRIILGVFLILLAWLGLNFFPYSDVVKSAIIFSLPLILFQSIIKACNVIFQSFLKYQYQSIAVGVSSVISVLLLLIMFYVFNKNLFSAVIALVIGGSIAPILSLYFVRDYIKRNVPWVNFQYWKFVLIDAFPLGMALLLNVFMVHTDRLLLSVLSTPFSVGIYSLAYKIFDVLLVIPTFFMNAMYPILIKMKERSEAEYKRTIQTAVFLMTILSILVTVFGVVSSSYLIPAIWGKEMAGAYIPFNILLLGSITFFISSPLSWILLIEGKQKVLPVLYGAAFIFNLVFNIIFIPRYDYNAAAVVTILTELIVLIVLYKYTRHLFTLRTIHLKEIKLFIKSFINRN